MIISRVWRRNDDEKDDYPDDCLHVPRRRSVCTARAALVPDVRGDAVDGAVDAVGENGAGLNRPDLWRKWLESHPGIPRKHVIPEYGRVITDLGQDWTTGIDYRQPPFSDLNSSYRTDINGIQSHIISHSFMIGLVKEFISFGGKRLTRFYRTSSGCKKIRR